MKNLFVFILFVVVFAAKAYAQFPIPSYGVDVSMGTTTFEHGIMSNSFLLNDYSLKKTVDNVVMTAGEDKIKISVDKKDTGTPQWAIVYIYSIDGKDILGPYTVVEDETFSQVIDERDWGVKVVDSSIGCKLSVWNE